MHNMKIVRYPAFLPLVVPCRVLALPVSHTPTVTAKTCVPLIVVSVVLFFLFLAFLAVKLAYMKHRRIGTIHAPPGTSAGGLSATTSRFGLHKQGRLHRGLLVGCLGSPTWETNLTAKLDRVTRRHRQWRMSLGYPSTLSASTRSRSTNYSSGSRLTKHTVLANCSGDADQLVLPLIPDPSRVPTSHGGSTSKTRRSVQRNTLTNSRLHYGDFGESHGVRSPGSGVPDVARRASPSSIRLVDGPSHSNQVEYSFLSVLPSDAVAISPLMGTRDSFQLSRCSLKCNRKPVPPMPPLPSFLPFRLPEGPEIVESQPLRTSEYLPPLRFSPLTSVVRVFHLQQPVEKGVPSSRAPDTNKGAPGSEFTSFIPSRRIRDASNTGLRPSPSAIQETSTVRPIRNTTTKSNHKASQSCKGLAIGGVSPRTVVTDEGWSDIESVVLRPLGPSRKNSIISQKPLKSCLRRGSAVPPTLICSPDSTFTISMSETGTRTCSTGTRWSAGDSLCTPMSDVDIEILGLDRFYWSDEVKVRSFHAKKDSVTWVAH